MQIASFDFASAAHLGCYGVGGYHARLLGATLLPLAAGGPLLALAWAARGRARAARKFWVNSFLLLTYLVYPTTCATVGAPLLVGAPTLPRPCAPSKDRVRVRLGSVVGLKCFLSQWVRVGWAGVTGRVGWAGVTGPVRAVEWVVERAEGACVCAVWGAPGGGGFGGREESWAAPLR